MEYINQRLITKTGKNFWQWSAVIAFFIGWALQIVAWITKSMPIMLVMFVLWGYAIWCAVYRPGNDVKECTCPNEVKRLGWHANACPLAQDSF